MVFGAAKVTAGSFSRGEGRVGVPVGLGDAVIVAVAMMVAVGEGVLFAQLARTYPSISMHTARRVRFIEGIITANMEDRLGLHGILNAGN